MVTTLMLKLYLTMALNARPVTRVSWLPDGRMTYVRQLGRGVLRARNWWDKRPAGRLFAADERDGLPEVVAKGGL